MTEINLTVTERATAELQDYLQQQGQPVRLAINPGGCSGFDIQFEGGLPQANDLVLAEGALLIDPISYSLISGATVDFMDAIGKEGFVVNNIPNMEARCGCGKSFSLAD